MAQERDLTNKEQGAASRHANELRETAALQGLAQVISELELARDKPQAQALWERAAQVLKQADMDVQRVEQVVSRRDVEGLKRLAGDARRLETQRTQPQGVAPPSRSSATTPPAERETGQAPATAQKGETPEPAIDRDMLERALDAFKRRAELSKPEAQSTVSGKNATDQTQAGVVATRPPTSFPHSVWDELVRQGRLKEAGHGKYELPQP